MLKSLIKNNRALLLNSKLIHANDYKLIISLLAYFSVAIFCFAYSLKVMKGAEAWRIGDWVINYGAGLVRRGLIGQILWEFSRLGFNLVWSTFFLQILCYFLIAYYTLKFFFSIERETSWLLFLFSPAFLFLFPFYGIAGGFRKEIMVFLSFCLLANGLLDKKLNHKYVLSSLLLYGVAVFSHELASFCLLFFIYLLHQSKTDNKKNSVINLYLAGYSVLSISGLLFAMLFPGNAFISNKMCQTLVSLGLQDKICDGAIKWLRYDINRGINYVVQGWKIYLLLYPVLLFLAMLPIFLTNWWKKHTLLIFFTFISLLPLFIVANDWGRWIHIYVFMLTILILFESCKTSVTIRTVSMPWSVVFIGGWSLPIYLPYWFDPYTFFISMFGLEGLLYRILNEFIF